MRLVIQLIGMIILFVAMSSAGLAHQTPAFSKKHWKMVASLVTDDYHATMARLSEMDVDIAGVDIKNGMVDALISEEEYAKLKAAGFEFEISQVKGVSRGPDSEYQTPEEVEAYLKSYSERYPELTKLVSIGKSLEGRDIWALKISDNPAQRELEEPALLFNSMHHAREVMGPEVGLDIVEYLLENYGSLANVTRWVEQNEIWVMPMFNVDGNNKMWNDDAWWRKNVRGGYGVDLNRNYPSGWNSCNGSSGWKWSQTYRGESPASEPETRAMMKFIEEVRPVFDISYHSYSELVIYPYGCNPKRTQTKEIVEGIGKEVASLLGYTPGTAWETLYNADGGDIDWMYEAFQVIPYVIELNSRSEGFHPDYNKWRDKTVKRNRAGWQRLLDRAQQSGIRGVFRIEGKAQSDYSLSVYRVKNGERELFQDYVGHKTGAYHIVVNPGEYELRFQSGKSLAVEKVVVGKELLMLDVEL